MKKIYRGVGLEVQTFPEDEMTTISAYQESDGLEIMCYTEWFLAKQIRKRLEYLCTELDEIFEDPEPYGFMVVDGELQSLPDESDCRYNRSVDINGQMQIEDYK